MNREERRVWGKKHNLENNKKCILPDQGRRFNEVSKEVEQNFHSWLKACGLSENIFLNLVKMDSFEMKYEKSSTAISTSFFIADRIVGIPLVCDNLNNSKNYRADLALFLMCVASKTNDDNIQKRFIEFIKSNGINT